MRDFELTVVKIKNDHTNALITGFMTLSSSAGDLIGSCEQNEKLQWSSTFIPTDICPSTFYDRLNRASDVKIAQGK